MKKFLSIKLSEEQELRTCSFEFKGKIFLVQNEYKNKKRVFTSGVFNITKVFAEQNKTSETVQTPCFYAQDQYQTGWDELVPSTLG